MDEESKALTKEEKRSIFNPDITPHATSDEKKKDKRLTINHSVFKLGKWLYDTPGTVNQESQVRKLIILLVEI